VSDGFELRTAPAVIFGCGSRRRIGPLVRALGRRAFLVTGGRSLAASGALDELVAALGEHGVTAVCYAVPGEPEVREVDDGVRRCVEASCDVVVGVGGGSALDAAKAIAAVAPNGGAAVDYVEGLTAGGPRALSVAPLPTLAVPTTAGSGSEVTKNAVLRVTEAAVKRSMRSDLMVPRVALIDPDLSRGAPQHVSVPAALDALTHLVEGFVSRGAQPTTDALAIEGVAASFATLSRVAQGSAPPDAAENLALASLWGGVVLANAGLGAVHGLVAPLGGRFAIPHGCGCGAMLASTVRANVTALRRRDPDSRALARYGRIAQLVAGPSARPEQAADAFEALRRGLGARSLSHYGVTSAALADLIADSRGGSMKSNPIVLSDAELETILAESLGDDAPPAGDRA
jgi:alcohol dehydrogenase class IV